MSKHSSFEPKALRKASRYLQSKLDSSKTRQKSEIVEALDLHHKPSMVSKLLDTLFKKSS